MKKTILVFVILLSSILSHGQVITIQAGTTFSKLDWTIGNYTPKFYNQTLIGYSAFVGVDYLKSKFLTLSSNFGILSKGGKGDFTAISGNNPIVTKNTNAALGYLSINTILNLKYQFKNKMTPFIGVGPRLDYLIYNSSQFDKLKSRDELNWASYGLILRGGLKYNLSKIQIGIQADYYLNFSKIADWPVKNTNPSNVGGRIKDNTFLLNLTIGYILK